MNDADRKTFEEVWAQKEAEGYQYGHDALEQVHFGFELGLAYAAKLRAEEEPRAWLHWMRGPVRVFFNRDDAMLELARLNREYPNDAAHRKMLELILRNREVT